MKYDKSFKKNPRYPHKRSEGLTRRGEERQARLMTGTRVMDGRELDRRTRVILQSATRDSALSSAAALVVLGYGPTVAWNIIERIVSQQQPLERE